MHIAQGPSCSITLPVIQDHDDECFIKVKLSFHTQTSIHVLKHLGHFGEKKAGDVTCLLARDVIRVLHMKCVSELVLPGWYLPPLTLKRFSITGASCEDALAPGTTGARRSCSKVSLGASDDELSEELLEEDCSEEARTSVLFSSGSN